MLLHHAAWQTAYMKGEARNYYLTFFLIFTTEIKFKNILLHCSFIAFFFPFQIQEFIKFATEIIIRLEATNKY